METIQQKITALVAGLILLLALGFIAHRLWPSPPKFNSEPVRGLGQALAEETAKAIQDHGQIVAVINPTDQAPGEPDHVQWEAFQTELGKHGSIRLAATEILSPDPIDMIPNAGCSRYQLKAILEKHADADAIVFFFSLPEWAFVEAILPQHVAPKILVGDRTASGTKTQYGGYFDHDVIAVLIARGASSAPTQSGQPATARGSFNQHFQIITPQNYQAMPD